MLPCLQTSCSWHVPRMTYHSRSTGNGGLDQCLSSIARQVLEFVKLLAAASLGYVKPISILQGCQEHAYIKKHALT